MFHLRHTFVLWDAELQNVQNGWKNTNEWYANATDLQHNTLNTVQSRDECLEVICSMCKINICHFIHEKSEVSY